MSAVENYFVSMTEMFIDEKPYGDSSLDEKFKKAITPIPFNLLRDMEDIMTDEFEDIEKAFGMLAYMFIRCREKLPESPIYNIDILLKCVEDIIDSEAAERIVVIAFCVHFINTISEKTSGMMYDFKENLNNEFKSKIIHEEGALSEIMDAIKHHKQQEKNETERGSRLFCAISAGIIGSLSHGDAIPVIANDIIMTKLSIEYTYICGK